MFAICSVNNFLMQINTGKSLLAQNNILLSGSITLKTKLYSYYRSLILIVITNQLIQLPRLIILLIYHGIIIKIIKLKK